MKLLDEIRRQPLHIRHVFMWTAVVIVSSIFGLVYVHFAQQRFIAMINPQPSVQPADEKTSKSPFALIGDTIANLRANIGGFIAGTDGSENNSRPAITPVPISPQQLP